MAGACANSFIQSARAIAAGSNTFPRLRQVNIRGDFQQIFGRTILNDTKSPSMLYIAYAGLVLLGHFEPARSVASAFRNVEHLPSRAIDRDRAAVAWIDEHQCDVRLPARLVVAIERDEAAAAALRRIDTISLVVAEPGEVALQIDAFEEPAALAHVFLENEGPNRFVKHDDGDRPPRCDQARTMRGSGSGTM